MTDYRLFNIRVLAVLCSLLSGCVSDSPRNFSTIDRSQIQTLEFDEEIVFPNEMNFYALKRPLNPRYSSYQLSDRSEKYRVKTAMELWEVDVKAMVIAKVKETMKNTGRFTFIDGYDALFADAKLKVRVKQYGFDQLTDLKDELRPTLALDLIVVQTLSSNIWLGSGKLLPASKGNKGYTLDEYTNNWKLLG